MIRTALVALAVLCGVSVSAHAQTEKFSQFPSVTAAPGDTVVGLHAGANAQFSAPRTLMTTDLSGYVDPTGSDSNPWPGTSGAPLATTQYAWDYGATTTDGAGYNLTFNIAAGSDDTLLSANVYVGWQTVALNGAGAGSTSLVDVSFGPNHTPVMAPTIYINDVTLVDDGASFNNSALYTQGLYNVYVSKTGSVTVDTTANPNSWGLNPFGAGGSIYVGDISHVGNAQSLFNGDTFTAIAVYGTVTFNNNVYSVGMMWSNDMAFIDFEGSTTGSATGPKAMIVGNGLVRTVYSPGLPSGLTPPIFWSDGVYEGYDEDFTFVPATGDTVTMSATIANIDPAGPLAALTIVLPSTATYPSQFAVGVPNQTARISTTQAIASVTWTTSDGSTIANGFPTSLTAGQLLLPFYGPVSNSWYP